MENKLKYKNKMTHTEVLEVVTHLVRIPQLYRAFKDHISAKLFKDAGEDDLVYGERPLAYIWLGLCNYYNSLNPTTPPDRELLTHYIREELSHNGEDDIGIHEVLFTDEDTGYLQYIFDPERASLNESTGKPMIQAFIIERSIATQFSRLKEQDAAMVLAPDDLKQQLAELADKASRVSSLGADVELTPVMPDDSYYARGEEPLISTGIPFLDSGLGGGQRKASAYGIIGATGAGKSTFGLQILVGNSMVNRAEVLNGGELGQCVYFTFEQPDTELIPFIQSNGCSIARRSLAPFWNLSSKPEDRKDYERRLWPASSDTERDRWNRNKDWFNQSLKIINMSGTPSGFDTTEEKRSIAYNRGRGGVGEMVNILENIVNNTGNKIRVVIIDYASLVIYRQYGEGADTKLVYQLLSTIGDVCRKQIGGRFDCPVWLLQQIAGARTGDNPCVPLHHSQAAGCKSFGDNLDTCICLGPPDCGNDRDNGSGKCLYMTFSKTRHVAGNGFDFANRILQHDSNFARLNDVTDIMRPNRGARRFEVAGGGGTFYEEY